MVGGKEAFNRTRSASMNGRKARIVAASMAVALVLAACSSDSGSSGGSGRLTKAQYIARADQICKAANRKAQALGAPTTTDPQALAQFLSKSGRIINDAVDQLKKLNPPKADEQKINTLVNGLQKSASYFPALVKAVKNQDTQQVKQVARKLQEASLKGAQIAQSYGFHVCAHSAATTASPAP
jgi:hypothetical protein